MTEPPLPLGKKLLFYSIVLAICVLVGLVGAEAIVRLARPNVSLMALTGRTRVPMNPYSAWALTDAFSAYRAKPGEYRGKQVNSHGFISTPELTVEKPPGTLRIVYLGGSSTAGTGHMLADEKTWPWIATELLREWHPDQPIEFINGALSGYSSFESYGRLWSRLRFFQPDVVLMYHGWNEMYYFNRVAGITRWRTLPDGSWSLDRTKSIATHSPLWIDRLIWPSQILSQLRLRLTEPSMGEAGPPPTEAGGEQAGAAAARLGRDNRPGVLLAAGWPQSGPPRAVFAAAAQQQSGSSGPPQDFDPRALEIWRDNLRLMRETAAVMGWELFVARQATLIVPDLPAEHRERCRYDLHGFGHEDHVTAFAEVYRVIDEEIPPERVVAVDRVSGRPELFYDHIHPTIEGARVIGELVARRLSESLFEER